MNITSPIDFYNSYLWPYEQKMSFIMRKRVRKKCRDLSTLNKKFNLSLI